MQRILVDPKKEWSLVTSLIPDTHGSSIMYQRMIPDSIGERIDNPPPTESIRKQIDDNARALSVISTKETRERIEKRTPFYLQQI